MSADKNPTGFDFVESKISAVAMRQLFKGAFLDGATNVVRIQVGKCILYGQVGLDLCGGPTDTVVAGSASVDAEKIARALVGLTEHGCNSAVWLVKSDAKLANEAMVRVPEAILLRFRDPL